MPVSATCHSDGHEPPTVCSACSQTVLPDAQFCSRCGRAVRPPTEPDASAGPARSPSDPVEMARRPLTVLFCDLVGSCRLTESLELEPPPPTQRAAISSDPTRTQQTE